MSRDIIDKVTKMQTSQAGLRLIEAIQHSERILERFAKSDRTAAILTGRASIDNNRIEQISQILLH